MHILVEKLAAELKGHGAKPSPLLLAVSGGADSVALLRGCLELRNLVPDLHVAHLNHQLRGDASRADAEWVREQCTRLGVPATIGECDVAAESAAAGIGIEEAARTA